MLHKLFLSILKYFIYTMTEPTRSQKIGHTVSTQKNIDHAEPSGSRYGQKRDGLVCAKPNRHVFTYFSGWGGRFELSFLR